MQIAAYTDDPGRVRKKAQAHFRSEGIGGVAIDGCFGECGKLPRIVSRRWPEVPDGGRRLAPYLGTIASRTGWSVTFTLAVPPATVAIGLVPTVGS